MLSLVGVPVPKAKVADSFTVADQFGKQAIRRGFYDRRTHGPLNLVIVAPDARIEEGRRFHARIAELIDSGSTSTHTMIGDTALAASTVSMSESRSYLASTPSESLVEKRRRTVLIYVLPRRDVPLTHESQEIEEIGELRSAGMVVVPATLDSLTSRASPVSEFHNLLFQAWLARGYIPWRLEHDFRAQFLVGLDASHVKTPSPATFWASVLLTTDGQVVAHSVKKGRRDESFSSGGGIEAFAEVMRIARERGAKRVIVHRDGRTHSGDWSALQQANEGIEIEYVPVAKRSNLLLYRDEAGQIVPPSFGDCVTDRENKSFWLCTSQAKDGHSAKPVVVRKFENTTSEKAVADVLAAALLPTPGAYRPTRLPATTYWADRVSKRAPHQRLRVLPYI